MPPDFPNRTDPWARMPLSIAPLLFFDLETTGLYPSRGARIAEIGLVDHRALVLHWTGDPARDGYDAALADAIDETVAALSDGIVVGHNLSFDLGFLAREADRLDIAGPRLRMIDTLALARRLLDSADAPSVPNHKLASLLDAFDLEPVGTLHTTLGDARSTRVLFWALVEHGDLHTLRDARMRRIDWAAF